MFRCQQPKGFLHWNQCDGDLDLYRGIVGEAPIVGLCPQCHRWRDLTPLEYEEVFTAAMRGYL